MGNTAKDGMNGAQEASNGDKAKGRGRPRKYAPGQSPLELKRERDRANGIVRKKGRPKKGEERAVLDKNAPIEPTLVTKGTKKTSKKGTSGAGSKKTKSTRTSQAATKAALEAELENMNQREDGADDKSKDGHSPSQFWQWDDLDQNDDTKKR